MAEQVLKNCKIYFDGYDISGQANSLNLTKNVELLDRTTFGSSARKRVVGLEDIEISLSGNYESTTIDSIFSTSFSVSATAPQITSIVPSLTTSTGIRAFLFKSITGELTRSGAIGELLTFDFAGYGEAVRMVRGCLLENSSSLSTGNGTPVQVTGTTLGASTQQKLYVTHHLLSGSSANSHLQVHIEMSSSSGFGSPSSAMKLNAVTGASSITAQWASTWITSTGPVWVRAVIASSSGTTPSYQGVICAGVL